MEEPWLDKLRNGNPEEAWSLFMERYRRLTFAMIRRYTTDHDEVMDLFAHICERLRANELEKLRKFKPDPLRRASFSTWLVAVERNLIVDWFRSRDGRPRNDAPRGLSPLAQRIYDYVFVRGYSHREANELNERAAGPASQAQWRRALLEVHRVVFSGSVALPSLPGDDIESADTVCDEESGTRVHEAMRTLDPAVQLAIQLLVVEEVPAADIARMLGLANAKAVYNKVYRGLAALRESLAERGIRSARDI